MNQENKDFNDKIMRQADQEFWEGLPDEPFWRPFNGNLVDHSSNDCTKSIIMFLIAVSSFSFGWFLSVILTYLNQHTTHT